MHDRDLRAALYSYVQTSAADRAPLVIHELGLCGQVRVDVAVVTTMLTGYELKGAGDDLRRLPKQIKVYSQVLDRACLVVTEKHLAGAHSLLPDWWGLLLARPGNRGTVLEQVQSAELNPEVDASALVQLLWRDEALAALERRDAARGVRGKPRAAIWSRLLETMDTATLRAEVTARLWARPAQPAGR